MAEDNPETPLKPGEARCPGMSYSDLLDLDTREVPDLLKDESFDYLGSQPISASRYTSPEEMQAENEKMWPKVWQFAAREEELPEPGDNVVYENAGKTFLLVRQEDGSVKGFYNVCLHRGRKLRTDSGFADELECPFHGFAWNNDGTLKHIPCRWDFGHLKDEAMGLPEVRVECWQGFVMISEDHDIAPFAQWAGEAAVHYERWNLNECYTAAWVGKVVHANWKVTAEAFMEAWHSIVTHPQILGFTGDANTRYDIYGDHMNRAITPNGVLSPHLPESLGQQHIVDVITKFVSENSGEQPLDEADASSKRMSADVQLEENVSNDPVQARKALAEQNRIAFGELSGKDYSDYTDSEMLDSFTYNIFPNFSPWGGFMPTILYRWRPWGDVDHCLMEVRILMRKKEGEAVPRPEMFEIGVDEYFSKAAHILGPSLANVFDQDMMNLPHVQAGLKSSPNNEVQLGDYQESRIRQFQQTMEKYLNA